MHLRLHSPFILHAYLLDALYGGTKPSKLEYQKGNAKCSGSKGTVVHHSRLLNRKG